VTLHKIFLFIVLTHNQVWYSFCFCAERCWWKSYQICSED